MIKELLGQIAEIDKQQKDLAEKKRACQYALSQLKSTAAHVLKRFVAGDYVVNSSGRHFWANNGNLLAAATREEIDSLEELIKIGIIAKD